ncbi:uncharacterized protein J4E88_008274 [Alternaria novae-zelandiae]|uniref:uncharacterized protein n=1 Tax=Alternaria triticimaculans TaxID=297637 RepID=UPI0020C4E84A|nr:uncharacterized protein J4E78_005873 [Alternaria triticimaculans]XP_049237170.1 uncharacterized protein J4E87_000860 [Alternaria ethzedia]XP_049252423.1 uncharacterized protein J4E88_008274 [Alternaria novae-zelandiae]XP_051327596.1 uncharacterized protein J4E85_003738 [Alternaria conjuncta]KAI4684048.1 hypothetical protein J4E81_009211 [Alternaria sp. BMP 2799]KAI4633696.1 hypothetical protein J4E87_000860 [Alternaria ethzedia]KAI4659445.1 hypothetical protein J4E78_005873 [Alternaria tri
MKLLFRVAHILLVLVLSSLLIYSVYYAFALLAEDQQHSSPQSVQADSELDTDYVSRKPSPQEIAASMNTLWDYLDDWDEEHCKNVCEASWVACRLRNCYHLPDVRKQEL